jgi:acyl-CoA synthetase (AMP-forming)/AMP-acid ligase II
VSTVTLLSVIANHGIAVPLSPAFPALELQYIINHSQSLMLLSSLKFQKKADEVLSNGLEHPPIHITVDKRLAEPTKVVPISLVDCPVTNGGLMLYTSGTTSRPVRACRDSILLSQLMLHPERRPSSRLRSDCSVSISARSVGIQSTRSPASRSAAPSHPRHNKCPPHPTFCRLHSRVSLSLHS